MGLSGMINFRLANSLKECAEAFNLANRIFSQNPTDQNYKTMLWAKNGNDQPEQLMLAVDGAKIIGLVRMCPSQMIWREEEFSTCGLTSICIDMNYRGKNFGRGLMEATVEHCDEKGFDASLLVARRAVDHFYLKFGFIGASSYPSITVQEIPEMLGTEISFRDFNLNNSQEYLIHYDHAYHESLRIVRHVGVFWQYAIQRLNFLDLTFQEIWSDGELIGYVLHNKDHVEEIAFADGVSEIKILSTLRKLKNMLPGQLMLKIPHQHQLLSSLKNCDVIFMSRQCRYGGHMLRFNRQKKELPINIGIYKKLDDLNKPFFALSKLDEI